MVCCAFLLPCDQENTTANKRAQSMRAAPAVCWPRCPLQSAGLLAPAGLLVTGPLQLVGGSGNAQSKKTHADRNMKTQHAHSFHARTKHTVKQACQGHTAVQLIHSIGRQLPQVTARKKQCTVNSVFVKVLSAPLDCVLRITLPSVASHTLCVAVLRMLPQAL